MDRQEAGKKYIAGSMTLKALAEEIAVPEETVRKWSKQDGWQKKRRDRRDAETGKNKGKLSRLMEASNEVEIVLAQAVKVMDGETEKAENISRMVEAINRQTATRLMLKKLSQERTEKKEADRLNVVMEDEVERLGE
ncbi:MAG: hypothetical protein IKQ41_11790 [Clostridia bacterium]|nr:hypothetical protein [Clostridia bacterium]